MIAGARSLWRRAGNCTIAAVMGLALSGCQTLVPAYLATLWLHTAEQSQSSGDKIADLIGECTNTVTFSDPKDFRNQTGEDRRGAEKNEVQLPPLNTPLTAAAIAAGLQSSADLLYDEVSLHTRDGQLNVAAVSGLQQIESTYLSWVAAASVLAAECGCLDPHGNALSAADWRQTFWDYSS